MPDSQQPDFEMTDKLKRILSLSHFFVAGSYVFDTSGRVFFQNENLEHPILKSLVNDPANNKKKDMTEISDEAKLFDGKILWFCSNGDLKIFSDTQVLTICVSEETYEKHMAAVSFFKPYFTTPPILTKNDDQWLYVEDYIYHQPITPEDDVFILQRIQADYENYFNNVRTTPAVYFQTLRERMEKSAHAVYDLQLKKVLEAIPAYLLDWQVPFVQLHGDLWTGNLLLSKSDDDKQFLWYIDWDTSSHYLFFYDFFKFIWNELDANQNKKYYQDYISGRYDEAFKALFAIFDLEFQIADREHYFYLFFLNFLLDDVGISDFSRKLPEIKAFYGKFLP